MMTVWGKGHCKLRKNKVGFYFGLHSQAKSVKGIPSYSYNKIEIISISHCRIIKSRSNYIF